MDNNLKKILKEFEEVKGQFVIGGWHDVVRLVAIAKDDMDYYWVFYDGKKFYWHSCIGGVLKLKGFLQDEDYKELERMSDLNDTDRLLLLHPKSTSYTLDDYIKEIKDEIKLPSELLTEIVFTDRD